MSAYSERDWLREVGLDPDKPAAEGYLRHGLEGQEEFDVNEYLLPSQSLESFAERSGEGADWVIENLLARGEVTDFAGRAKLAGKTTFWCSGIAAIAAGETHAGLETQPTKFLYLTEQGNNFLEAVEDAGLMDHPDALRIVQYRHVAGTAWASLIDAAARDAERMGAGAVIVDTFATFSGLADAEENLSGPVGERMRAARLAAQKHNVAVVIIRHTGKDGRPRGSSSFEAEADICVVLSKPEGRHDPRVRKLSAVGRHGVWERNVQLVDGHFVSLGGDDHVAFKKAVAFIRATLPASPDAEFKKRDLLEARKPADDISSASVDRALEFLVKEEAVGERQLMNARGKPRVYWLAVRGPEDPDADQNKETRVDMREGVHFQQTSPLSTGVTQINSGKISPTPHRPRAGRRPAIQKGAVRSQPTPQNLPSLMAVPRLAWPRAGMTLPDWVARSVPTWVGSARPGVGKTSAAMARPPVTLATTAR